MDEIVFGNGCFWCTEAVFSMLQGVRSVEPGYAGGHTENPTYEDVCSGSSGHAEAIRLTFDPKIISRDDILTVFFGSHDPTTHNRQGNDIGPQYRSVIFYRSEFEKAELERFIQDLQPDGEGDRIVTTLEPLTRFYPAEDYHKEYFRNNRSAGYCRLVIEPKLEKVRSRFAQLVKA